MVGKCCCRRGRRATESRDGPCTPWKYPESKKEKKKKREGERVCVSCVHGHTQSVWRNGRNHAISGPRRRDTLRHAVVTRANSAPMTRAAQNKTTTANRAVINPHVIARGLCVMPAGPKETKLKRNEAASFIFLVFFFRGSVGALTLFRICELLFWRTLNPDAGCNGTQVGSEEQQTQSRPPLSLHDSLRKDHEDFQTRSRQTVDVSTKRLNGRAGGER